MPLQPAFSAHLAGSDDNVTGDGTVYTIGSGTNFTEVFDQNNDFNVNGTFTAPVTGRYEFTIGIQVQNLDADTTFGSMDLETSNRTYFSANVNYAAMRTVTTAADKVSLVVTYQADMDASDTATSRIRIDGTTQTVGLYGDPNFNTFFQGKLVC
jgi:hypothetical protein